MIDASTKRTAEHEINPLFVRRWSPRAMSGEVVSNAEMMQLFEAARWAPSSFNEQEWRYVFAVRDSEHWNTLFDLLVEANQAWCKDASHLLLIASRRKFTRNDNDNAVHSFDTGTSFQNLALQGAEMGLVVHGMGGFDAQAARDTLKIPAVYAVDAMAAIGRPGPLENLPEGYQKMEAPTDRKKVTEFISEGSFPFE